MPQSSAFLRPPPPVTASLPSSPHCSSFHLTLTAPCPSFSPRGLPHCHILYAEPLFPDSPDLSFVTAFPGPGAGPHPREGLRGRPQRRTSSPPLTAQPPLRPTCHPALWPLCALLLECHFSRPLGRARKDTVYLTPVLTYRRSLL